MILNKHLVRYPLSILLLSAGISTAHMPANRAELLKEGDYNYYITRSGSRLSYEAADPTIDTTWTLSPVTNRSVRILAKQSPGLKELDRRPVLRSGQLSVLPAYKGEAAAPDLQHLLQRTGLEDMLRNMEAGYYRIRVNNLLIDTAGRIVHFAVELPVRVSREHPFWPDRSGSAGGMLTEEARVNFLQQLAAVLLEDQFRFSPGTDRSGHPVPCLLEDGYTRPGDKQRPLEAFFTVKHHKLRYNR